MVQDLNVAALSLANAKPKILWLFRFVGRHCAVACYVRPNVRVKRETAVWRLARELHDEPLRLAGQAPRRWLSA